ncbi:MAG: hypothetical protein ABFS03_11850 [Chloroflexota bacterium]
MSILKNINIMNAQRVSAFLLLALLFSNPVCQFLHVHHSHQDESFEIEISYHPIEAALEHASAHSHSDENSSSTNDNQHDYKNQVDWNNRRLQTAPLITLAAQEFSYSLSHLPPAGFKESISFYQEPALTKEQHYSVSIIRGPPLLG